MTIGNHVVVRIVSITLLAAFGVACEAADPEVKNPGVGGAGARMSLHVMPMKALSICLALCVNRLLMITLRATMRPRMIRGRRV
jgi:hypothetical protein